MLLVKNALVKAIPLIYLLLLSAECLGVEANEPIDKAVKCLTIFLERDISEDTSNALFLLKLNISITFKILKYENINPKEIVFSVEETINYNNKARNCVEQFNLSLIDDEWRVSNRNHNTPRPIEILISLSMLINGKKLFEQEEIAIKELGGSLMQLSGHFHFGDGLENELLNDPINLFIMAIKQDPDNWEAHYYLGKCYFKRADLGEGYSNKVDIINAKKALLKATISNAQKEKWYSDAQTLLKKIIDIEENPAYLQ